MLSLWHPVLSDRAQMMNLNTHKSAPKQRQPAMRSSNQALINGPLMAMLRLLLQSEHDWTCQIKPSRMELLLIRKAETIPRKMVVKQTA
jgi:hypothetical protein